ncbi:DUF2939 domain-containing protein [Rhabdochromatium marinum]|uniref:DUF2939 domain-containing protein n=1 Tax=Rhabdochromatium marinum TaxID=48729 RepID=UPI001907A327|nr:DUF2939 domain-containing protein [Rhabdochromatium marinum]MBK1649736.1 hypothetical protein [Rhabdochromatium marinum]
MTQQLPPQRWHWWMREWCELRQRRLRLPTWTRRALLAVAMVLLVLFVSPYWTLWRLSQAARSDAPEALAPFVDLEAVRREIRRRLNKDVSSHIGAVSDPFIAWIAQGLQRQGAAAIDSMVTLDWINGLLHGDHTTASLLNRVRYAFYDPPHGFLIELAHPDGRSIMLQLRPAPLIWRITTVYY